LLHAMRFTLKQYNTCQSKKNRHLGKTNWLQQSTQPQLPRLTVIARPNKKHAEANQSKTNSISSSRHLWNLQRVTTWDTKPSKSQQLQIPTNSKSLIQTPFKTSILQPHAKSTLCQTHIIKHITLSVIIRTLDLCKMIQRFTNYLHNPQTTTSASRKPSQAPKTTKYCQNKNQT
jgi:hypothetical protein